MKYLILLVGILVLLFMFGCVGEEHKTESNITTGNPTLEENYSDNTSGSSPTTDNITNETETHRIDTSSDTGSTSEEMCEGLFGDDYDLCLALVHNDPEYCNNDNCFLRFAINTSRSEVCEHMSTPAMACYCRALVDGDECKSCPSTSSRDLCYSLLTENTDQVFCSRITLPRYQRDCYTYLAVREHNPNLCKPIEDSYLRDECYREYAKETGDVSSCSKQFVESWVDSCYRDAAYANGKPQLCNQISRSRNRYLCYSVIFESASYTLSDCEEIVYPAWRDRCIKFLAFNTGNSSYCEYVNDPDDRKRCYVWVESVNATE